MSMLTKKVIWKLFKTKTNFKYLTGYSDKVVRPLVLIMAKMNRLVDMFRYSKLKIKTVTWCISI